MTILIKLQFIILLFLYGIFFLKLLKKGFSFSLGIVFGVIYFIFIPLTIFIITDKVEISTIDFDSTNLKDIIFSDNIIESIILIFYLYTILLFVYYSEFFQPKVSLQSTIFPLKWKTTFSISMLIGIFIFIAAGIHKGGNWYISREAFFQESGFLGLLLIDSFIAIKIIFITTILNMYRTNKMNFSKFIIIVLIFSIVDVILTGNRIYVFVLFSAIGIELINKYRLKMLLSILIITPLGYFFAIYRHIRGELFINGIPTFENFLSIISNVIERDPPSINGLLLGISESVNFNVIYEVLNFIRFENALFGETFLKTFVFFIPRSLWTEKPISITQISAKWFAPDAEHLSLVTTIIGETHANFYLFGIILLPFILFFTNQVLTKIFLNDAFSNILLFIIGLLMFRMPYSDIIILTIFVFIFYKIMLIINKVKYE